MKALTIAFIVICVYLVGYSAVTSAATVIPTQETYLSWTAVTTRTDGSALLASDVHGYNVYSGFTPDTLSLIATVVGGVVRYTDTLNLPPAVDPYVIYYGVTAVDIDGLEGDLPPLVSKTFIVSDPVDPTIPPDPATTAAPSAPAAMWLGGPACIRGCTLQTIP